jgi:hypothetical protein
MNASHAVAVVVAACMGIGCGEAPAPPPVVAPAPSAAPVVAAPPQCPKDLIVEVDGTTVWKLGGSGAVAFRAGFRDADAPPKTFAPAKGKGPKIDVAALPYVTMPADAKDWGAAVGDLVAVVNMRSMRVSFAIVADVAPSSKLGQGSGALAKDLGIATGKDGGQDGGVVYAVFPKSGNGAARSASDIAAEGQKLFDAAGGRGAMAKCFH